MINLLVIKNYKIDVFITSTKYQKIEIVMVQGVVPVPCTHMFYATVMNGYTFTVTWVTQIHFRCREEYYRLVTLILEANVLIYYP